MIASFDLIRKNHMFIYFYDKSHVCWDYVFGDPFLLLTNLFYLMTLSPKYFHLIEIVFSMIFLKFLISNSNER